MLDLHCEHYNSAHITHALLCVTVCVNVYDYISVLFNVDYV